MFLTEQSCPSNITNLYCVLFCLYSISVCDLMKDFLAVLFGFRCAGCINLKLGVMFCDLLKNM